MMQYSKRVLTFLAHPDDEVLGCGGTLAKLARLGASVQVIIPVKSSIRPVEIKSIKASQLVLQFNSFYYGNFPDNELDKVTMLSVIQHLEYYIDAFEPDLIITHHWRCANIDHQRCYEAAMIATRPVGSHINVISCEIPSSTGWLRPTYWEPNLYVEISREDLDRKLSAMKAYDTEFREYPHPRSYGAIEALAMVRGSESGFDYAEAFMVVRSFG